MSLLQKSLLVTSSALPSLSTPAAGGFGQPAEGVTRVGDGTGQEGTGVSRARNSGCCQPAPGWGPGPGTCCACSPIAHTPGLSPHLPHRRLPGQTWVSWYTKKSIISNTSCSPQLRAYFLGLVSFPRWLRTEETFKCPPEPNVNT